MCHVPDVFPMVYSRKVSAVSQFVAELSEVRGILTNVGRSNIYASLSSGISSMMEFLRSQCNFGSDRGVVRVTICTVVSVSGAMVERCFCQVMIRSSWCQCLDVSMTHNVVF